MNLRRSTKGLSISLMVTVIFVTGIFLAQTGIVKAQSVGITLPSIPTGLTTTVVPPSTITLSWNASTESSGTIAGYYVYRNGVQITTTNISSFSDVGLTSGVYAYTVSAFDTNGNISPQSAPLNASIVLDTMPPSVPTGITISGVTSTNSAYTQIPVTISWSASTDNVGVAGYRLYRNGTLLTSSTAPYTSTSYNDMLTAGTFWYTVVAYDAAQNSSAQSPPVSFTINYDNNTPSLPTNLSAEQISAGSVNLTWTSSTDPIGIAGYQVFRNGIQIASAAGSPYADAGVSVGNQYMYTIAAYDIAGNVSFQSAPVTIMVQTANGPGIPYDLSANALSTSSVRFAWAPVGDSLPLTGYTLYRNGSQIAVVSSTVTTYLDTGLASGTYVYGLSATDISGTVSATATTTAVTVPATVASTIPTLTAPIGAPVPLVATASSSSISNIVSPSGVAAFTQYLYFGSRSSQVTSLQSLLAQQGYLSSASATGYFGTLTLHALEQFQCAQKVVCTGGAGWGTVGPKTRAALNSFGGNSAIGAGANVSATSATSSETSPSTLAAELQTLEAELAALEGKAQ